MTRTVRSNSSSHAEAAVAAEVFPRFAGKSTALGDHNQNPFKSKKNGAGRGNWGREEDELVDVEDNYNFNPNIQRRRSNSNGGFGANRRPSWVDAQSKFDNVDEEDGVFEDEE
ncbi:hypothetical protein V1512DRAFT_276740 [Lipomyces arxii]|uniref:uncharacterized protein n=1 Tax=Lipomyces arxii TaxID=56418 RepID=UPI0034CE84DF